jgi:hypothetical protein
MPARDSGGYDRALFQGPIYRTWFNMKTRCRNTRTADFGRYGGRGIVFCDKWDRFAGFYEDMGASYQPGLTLERIDNNRGYSKDNCRWATRTEQANNRRSSHFITFNGETKTLAQWARSLGIKRSTLGARLTTYHWPIEKALGVCDR